MYKVFTSDERLVSNMSGDVPVISFLSWPERYLEEDLDGSIHHTHPPA